MIHTPPGQWPELGPAYLESTRFIDSATPAIRRYAEKLTANAKNDVERAVKLFYAVRDGWRYDPYSSEREPEKYYVLDGQLRVIRHWYHNVPNVKVFIYRGQLAV